MAQGTDSFRLDVRRLDHRPPFFDLRLLQGGEGLRRLLLARENLLPDIGEPSPRRRVGERGHDRDVLPFYRPWMSLPRLYAECRSVGDRPIEGAFRRRS